MTEYANLGGGHYTCSECGRTVFGSVPCDHGKREGKMNDQMTKNEIYKVAIEKWGIPSQLEMMVEECAELIQALQKLKRVDASNEFLIDGATEHICEEIADVEILIEQMREIFTDKRIDYHKEQKLFRLRKLIS